MRIRYSVLVTIVLLAYSVARAQTPEHIYGKNKRLMPTAYYEEQARLWKAVVEKEPTNAEGWLNYYTASRNAYVVGQEGENKDSRGQGRFARLDTIVHGMEVHVPGTFAYCLVKWANGYNDPRLLPYLEQAHALAPQRPEPYMDLIIAYERMGREALRDSLCKAYLQLRDYSPGLLGYGYNLLMGLAPDAVVFAHGDKDSEAIWILQGGMGIRRDVHLLNLDLLLVKDYRERQFEHLGLPALPFDPLADDAAFDRYRKEIIRTTARALPQRPVYVSLSAEGPYTEPIASALHLTGLAYRFSLGPFDPVPDLVDNYTGRYALYELTQQDTDVKDISIGNVHQFNGNYLPSLFLICEHYRTNGDVAAQLKYEEIARQVARDAGRSAEFEAYYNK